MHPYINILSINIPTYWIIAVIGVFVCFLFIKKSNKKYGLEKCDVVNITAIAVVGAVIGSKVLYIFTVLPELIRSIENIRYPIKLIEFLITTGFVFYGGFIGAIVAVYLYCRRYKLNLIKVSLLYTPAIPLFHFFGRIGCYFAGCCYGKDGFPVQLLEAGFNLILFFILVYLRQKSEKSYFIFKLYIIVYGVGRFIFEFFRGDEIRGFIWIFSVSQWISLLLITLVIIWSVKGEKSADKRN